MEALIQMDGDILLYIQEFIRQEWMHPFWIFITSLGDGGWFWIVCSAALLIPKGTRRVGITALMALAVGALITNVALKNIVARIRPYEVVDGLTLLIGKPHDYSFPSGHTCASFAAALVYYRMLPKRWGAAALILASLIAFSRLYVGVHYPTDILGGAAVGAAASMASLWIARHIHIKRSPNGDADCKNKDK